MGCGLSFHNMQKVKRTKEKSQDYYEITDPRQFKALRSAIRQEVVDVMESLAPCTIASLADRLGRPAASLYFHVRALQRVGLIKTVGVEGDGRDKAALYALPAKRLRLSYDTEPKTRQRQVGPIADSLLRLARRDVKRGLSSAGTTVSGPARQLWVLRARGWLTPSELQRLNRQLAAISELISSGKERRGAAPIALAFALAPAIK